MKEKFHPAKRPRVVIVGAGFGGLIVAKALANTPVDVTVIDQRNYHLFQPLLYQVATAALSPADIAFPIRTILKGHRNPSVMLAKVTSINTDSGEVVTGDRRIPFDYLVLATGAQHAYFGHDDWEAFAKGIKTVDDATGLRRKILLAFENAEFEPDPEERSRLLTFVIVGGGATGVEMAGAIAELARKALAADFRAIDPTHARILLVEAGPSLLFSRSISRRRHGARWRISESKSAFRPPSRTAKRLVSHLATSGLGRARSSGLRACGPRWRVSGLGPRPIGLAGSKSRRI